jgi:hypothetical protein
MFLLLEKRSGTMNKSGQKKKKKVQSCRAMLLCVLLPLPVKIGKRATHEEEEYIILLSFCS